MTLRILGVAFFLLWMAAPAGAQAEKKSNAIPPFKMLQTNNRYFEAKDLDKAKPVVLIYFAPDCPHCQVLLDGVFKNMAAFKKTQLILVTFKPLDELQLFERQFNTAAYPNVKTGTEGTTFFLRYYYNLSNTPFTAVFNKGNLVCAYRNINTPVSQIISCVKQLK